MTRVLYLVSHPIQYQAPLLRLIAAQPDIRLRVLFERIPENPMDPGFGRRLAWDVPLLEGYDHGLFTVSTLHRELDACDVVWLHGWQGWKMKAALLAARARGRPVLMRGENWIGAMPDGPIKRIGLRMLLAQCDGFLVIGTRNREYYARLGIASSRLFDMPYSVDNDFFSRNAAVTDTAALRVRLGLPPDRPIILYAGKLQWRKHPHTLLAAWRRAFAEPKTRPLLVFVGDGSMAHALATGDSDVHFLGFRNQTEMPALYAMADLFVLASEREPWGLAINEAMACGTAVIASDQCGATADLVDQSVGAVVPPGDVAALATALRAALPKASALGEAARRRVAGWSFAADLAGLRAALARVGHRR